MKKACPLYDAVAAAIKQSCRELPIFVVETLPATSLLQKWEIAFSFDKNGMLLSCQDLTLLYPIVKDNTLNLQGTARI